MPFYRYKCSECGKEFRKLHSMNETPDVNCECGGKAEKTISNIGISFKGSGYYINDAKSKSSSK